MNLIEIKIPTSDKNHEIIVKDENCKPRQHILVENGQVIEIAEIINVVNTKKEIKDDSQDKVRFVRIAQDKDTDKAKKLKEKALQYLNSCKDKILQHNLDTMKLLDAELSFDEKKLTFYFSAEGRVDFRELVSDLVKTYKKIIRLQQIGSRDEAKKIGGIGKCGRKYCCSTFLQGMDSVTLDMAKYQEIGLGSSKLTGGCGKLMCCLSYELENYKKMAKNLPHVGDIVKYQKDKGRVISRNILKQTYMVETADGKRSEVEI